jgi:hypothetical protein
MTRHAKTTLMLKVAVEVLQDGHPMTVRQVYYQLVSRQVIKNTRSAYQSVSKLLVDARKRGEIPWDWIEDRLRRPRSTSMWSDLPDFFETVRRAYRRDVWQDQPAYLEVWLEKDALSGIFEDVLDPYGVTLNVGRGFDGWSSIHGAAERYTRRQERGRQTAVLYFGDFDPSGEDMFRSLRERLADRGATPELVKVALIYEDIERYDLPPDFTKATDTRTAKFVAKYGDLAVELDALPGPVLRQRLESEVGARMDAAALEETGRKQREDAIRLEEVLEAVGCGGVDASEDES